MKRCAASAFALLLALGSVRATLAQPASVPDPEIVVTLVGTGGPEMTPERQGESTLIEAGGQSLLFDAGRGTLDGLYRSHVLPQAVTRIFLTHLHSDHIAGLPDLWMTPWFLLRRSAKLEVWGPPGTQAMIDGMRAMYAHDLDHRSDSVFKREDLDIAVHEIAAGPVYAHDGVTLTAVAVDHKDGNPAFGYRIQAGGRAVFLTGDCTFTPELVAAAKSVDVLVSNVVATTPAFAARYKPVLAKLMLPEQAAALFAATKPRLAVYSHIVKKGLPGAAGDRVILERTRAAGYVGPLIVAADHTRIRIGKAIVVEPVNGPLPDLDSPEAKF